METMAPRDIDTVNGQVAHTIHNHGPQYYHFAPPTEQQLTWWDLSPEDLATQRKVFRAECHDAWRAYWFNLPTLFLCAYTFFVLVGAFSVLTSPSPFHAPIISWLRGQYTFLFVIAHIGIILFLAFWMQKIRRVEIRVVRHAQADIDAIDLMLRRRK